MNKKNLVLIIRKNKRYIVRQENMSMRAPIIEGAMQVLNFPNLFTLSKLGTPKKTIKA
jgi:hypothetical protein